MHLPHYAIAALFFFGFFFIGLPYYIYRLIKGIMTHDAELKYKYSQQNQQSEEKPEE